MQLHHDQIHLFQSCDCEDPVWIVLAKITFFACIGYFVGTIFIYFEKMYLNRKKGK